MNQRNALYQAILKNHDDLSRRLIYADWLEENGNEDDNALSEFIRVEIELKDIPSSDSRWQRLSNRRYALLNKDTKFINCRICPFWHVVCWVI
ncbi:MAG: TIGR02996 domain-containing protein [Gemmataceae bacterium]